MGPKSALLLAALKTKETSIIIRLISKNIEGKQKLSKASNFGVSSLTGDRPGYAMHCIYPGQFQLDTS